MGVICVPRENLQYTNHIHFAPIRPTYELTVTVSFEPANTFLESRTETSRSSARAYTVVEKIN